MDINTVKTMLGITSDKHDAYLVEVVPLFVEFARDYCNQPFVDADGKEALPGGVKVFVAKAVEHNMQKSGIKGRSMGDVSYSYETDFPPAIMRGLRLYRKVRFV